MDGPQSIDENYEGNCPQCNFHFEGFKQARAHMAKFHNFTPVCPICSKTEKSTKRLSYHLRTDHPRCSYCSVRFLHREEYYLHNLVKHIEEIIVSNKLLNVINRFEKRCRLCGLKFSKRCYAHLHLQYAHPLLKPFFSNLRSS
ncbi:unnamed protein product [Blepharisma stoltei]|uniref:C2H2-type domain-containing protein n=1 Tax=Blepharisma stoltei TaxID=1481888 RepID=A0AAU9K321_9CILI|nr:unnamed protein product [Blepharisma stoltei]